MKTQHSQGQINKLNFLKKKEVGKRWFAVPQGKEEAASRGKAPGKGAVKEPESSRDGK